MADFSNYNNGDSVYNTLAERKELTNEKLRISQHILSVSEQIETKRKEMSKKHFIYLELCTEQISVFDSFSQYYSTWKQYVANTPETIDRTEMHLEVQTLLEILTKLGDKWSESGAIFKSFSRNMKFHLDTLQSTLQMVDDATFLEELSTLSIPNSDWLQCLPDPNIEQLADEWNQMKLQSKVLSFLDQLQYFIQQNCHHNEATPN